MATLPESRSIGELLRDLASDSTALVRQELALAKAEAQEKLHQSIAGGSMVVMSALLAFAGLIILLHAAVYGLEKAGIEPWLAALIVGGVVVVIGLLLVQKARHDLTAQSLTAGRTAVNLRKDLNLVKGHVS
jgi:hypothetical protein